MYHARCLTVAGSKGEGRAIHWATLRDYPAWVSPAMSLVS
jgi:hypothetical protein